MADTNWRGSWADGASNDGGGTRRFVGHVDAFEPALAGWLVDTRQPGVPVRFTVVIDHGRACIAAVADLPRPDVAATGRGGPACGFRIELPAHLFDGTAHDIAIALPDGERLDLPGLRSPVVLGPVAARVVPLTAADIDAVTAMLHRTYRESGLEPEAITERYVAGWIGKASASGGALVGAQVGGKDGAVLAGYALLEPAGDASAPIGAVALSVLEAYRRKGLGERLMRALLDAAGERGQIAEVWLAVAEENLPARRLYEKLGFAYCASPAGLRVPAGYLAAVWLPGGGGR